MSFTHLEFPIGGNEKESQCLINRDLVTLPGIFAQGILTLRQIDSFTDIPRKKDQLQLIAPL
jgi:hypothetical protein